MLAASKSSQEALDTISANLTMMAGLASLVLELLSPGKKSLTFIEGILAGILANVASAPASTDVTAPERTRQWAQRLSSLAIFGEGT